jgi:hypothetical protein
MFIQFFNDILQILAAVVVIMVVEAISEVNKYFFLLIDSIF